MTEIKNIEPLVSQLVLRNLGMYASTYLANDLYFLFKAINLLKADLGEEYLKKEWEKKGKSWERVNVVLKNAEILANSVKGYYDRLEDKKFEKKNQEKEIKKFFLSTASKIPIINPELYEIFIFLIKHSSVQRQTISVEALKILEHSGYRKIEIGKSPKESVSNEETNQ